MKTAKFTINYHKDSDGYIDLCSNLFPYTEEEMKKVDEDDNFEPKANKICNEWFEYGEYGSFELIIDENMNIVGGKVIKTGK
jgi:hypothetical protein